jgi:hypothetical protein
MVIFRERWEKKNVSWSADGSEIEFTQTKMFHFSREKSVGDETDLIVMPNIPMIVSAYF